MGAPLTDGCLSYEEIGRRLGISHETVRAIERVALAKLRRAAGADPLVHRWTPEEARRQAKRGNDAQRATYKPPRREQRCSATRFGKRCRRVAINVDNDGQPRCVGCLCRERKAG